MLQEYLYYIIAIIVLVTSITIYLLRKSQSPLDESEIIKTQEDNHNEIDDKDELKDIEIIEETVEETVEEVVIPTAQVTPKKRSKVKVPKHGKISKEAFKDFAGERILVAEDNFINQKVINGLLADTGIELVMADNGQIALDILEKDNNFCMVLMDAHMPVLDGFDTTRIIRTNSRYEHIVVVALSGDTAVDDIKKMTNAGMEEHLAKPLVMDALYDVLYSYIKKEDTDDFIEIISTKELDGEKGLSVCGGDDSFYKEILNEFLDNYSTSAQNLQKLLKNDEMQSADKLLLDIIGISANIGADPLNVIALRLKEAIKNQNEKSYPALLDAYQYHLSVLVKDIKDYL